MPKNNIVNIFRMANNISLILVPMHLFTLSNEKAVVLARRGAAFGRIKNCFNIGIFTPVWATVTPNKQLGRQSLGDCGEDKSLKICKTQGI